MVRNEVERVADMTPGEIIVVVIEVEAEVEVVVVEVLNVKC